MTQIGISIGTLNLMPNWQDEGIILINKPYAELHSITSILTKTHGRHAGMVKAGQTSKKRSILQPGTIVDAQWHGRLVEQLGTFKIELSKNYSALLIDTPIRLAALSSICSLLETSLPEREPQIVLWKTTLAILEILTLSEDEIEWLPFFIRWELGLLRELGFALDLKSCAVTGTHKELAFVSPRTGRAVSKTAAGVYADRLLVLPMFLGGHQKIKREFTFGLQITGHFLQKHIFNTIEKKLPNARERLVYMVDKLNI